MGVFEVGFARQEITPSLGARLFGYVTKRESKNVHDPLYASAICFRSETEKAMLVSLDLCMLHGEQIELYRQKISNQTGILPQNICIHTIHTHSGPETATAVFGKENTAYMQDVLEPALQKASQNAVMNLYPAEMGIGTTECFVGVNRREVHNGTVILGENPDAPMDAKMHVIAFRTKGGIPIVNIIHYGAHPTSCGVGTEITRDWPGVMVEYVEKETGIPAVFFNGAMGDVGPRGASRAGEQGVEKMEKVGAAAGKDAVRAWKGIASYAVPTIDIVTENITLPYDRFPTKREAQKTLEELGAPVNAVDFMLEDRMKRIIWHYEENGVVEDKWNFKQTIIRIGEVLLVPYPFEVFSRIFLMQQEKSPFLHTLCMSCTNGYECYLPTKEQIPYGGYEINSFKRQRLFAMTDDAGERIVLENQRLIGKLKQNKIRRQGK